jgi:tRNA 2-thiouridine synthesizing protein E
MTAAGWKPAPATLFSAGQSVRALAEAASVAACSMRARHPAARDHTMTTVSVPLDGEGFLVNRDDWNEDLAAELARADEFEMNDQVMQFIRDARAMYDNDGVVPPIRIFAKKQGVSTKELYNIFKKGPMKLICKWGGLPKPTGCV